jgi:hypothetical protein
MYVSNYTSDNTSSEEPYLKNVNAGSDWTPGVQLSFHLDTDTETLTEAKCICYTSYGLQED